MSNKSEMNRLHKMIEAVKKAAEGDYSVSIDVSDQHDEIDLLADAINEMVGHARQQLSKAERKRAGKALQMFKFAVEEAPDAVFFISRDGGFPYVNEQACRSHGYTFEEMMRLHLWDIAPNLQKDRWLEQWEDVKRVGKSMFETVHRCKDGEVFPVEVSANHVKFGEKEYHIAFVRDITKRKQEEEEKAKLESQLIQARKMESVGRLAGGVAHDFNNMLSVILGYAELIKSQLLVDDPLRAHVLEIEKAAKRSRDTTRQLLAVSRKQIISPRPMNLNAQSISEKEDAPIDLLVTDVVMPGMSGPELSDKVKVSRPGIKVLFMSPGYTSNVIVDQGMLEEGVHFIQKPFSKNDLARKIHDVMGDKYLNHANPGS